MGGIGDIVFGDDNDDDDDDDGGIGISLEFAVLMMAYAPHEWRFFRCHLYDMAALAELLSFCCCLLLLLLLLCRCRFPRRCCTDDVNGRVALMTLSEVKDNDDVRHVFAMMLMLLSPVNRWDGHRCPLLLVFYFFFL